MSNKALILLSGGLDSTTCLAIAKSQGYECYALSFDYGQKNRSETNAAKKIAQHFAVKQHKVFTLPIHEFGGSALTDSNIAIPDYQGDEKIPSTYVPARNTIFLSVALAFAEVFLINNIFIGANAVDYSGYPDCRPDYFAAFTKLANLATKTGIEGNTLEIHTPLLQLTKTEIILTGIELGVDYGMTVTCYRADENGRACGECDSCTFRKEGFVKAGISDPTKYTPHPPREKHA
jgi:7-cyano-7-deazaguanine synthase